jgi:hypothetical protein
MKNSYNQKKPKKNQKNKTKKPTTHMERGNKSGVQRLIYRGESRTLVTARQKNRAPARQYKQGHATKDPKKRHPTSVGT